MSTIPLRHQRQLHVNRLHESSAWPWNPFLRLLTRQNAGGYHLVTAGEKFSGGRYTALHPLGQGHYSTVWMAHDAMTGQHVAMKVRSRGQGAAHA